MTITMKVTMSGGPQRNQPPRPNRDFTYQQVNVRKLYILPTQCIYVFCMDLRTKQRPFP